MRALPTRALAAVMVVVFCAAFSPKVAAEEGPPASSDARVRQADRAPGQDSLAERYLFRLAEKSRKRRRLAGGISLALGAAGVAGGAAALGGEDDCLGLNHGIGTALVITGGICLVGGTISLAVASPAERTYGKIRAIQDPALREQACAGALADLAKKAKRTRMIEGAIIAAVGIVAAVASNGDDDASSSRYLKSAAYAGGCGLTLFLVKSPAERTYRAYLSESHASTVPDLVLGFGPRGGFRVGLSLDF